MDRPEPNWLKLDNAGKIYPAARRRNWSSMFRLSATLSEPVEPEVLQAALDITLKRFPSIAVRLRRGMFWYYLEEISKAPEVMLDCGYPCVRMSPFDIRQCAFRVLYYENRIAVEIFHALTDGSGGLVFLKSLVAEYLSQKYAVDIPNTHGILDRSETPRAEELEDSFFKHEGDISVSRRETMAYKIPGVKEKDGFLNLITGTFSVGSLLKLAKSYDVTLTVFLTSVMIFSIVELQNEYEPNRKKHKPVKVMVPVNLRNYFKSSTLRNFSTYITPGIDPRTGTFTFEDIIKSVHHQIGAQLTKNNLNTKFTTNVKSEKMLVVKIMPLFIKNLVMRIVYNIVGEKISSITISNLGNVELPDEMRGHVSRMDLILGVQALTPCNCSVLSYGDKLYISFIRNIRESALERKFFTYLRSLNIHALIESNQIPGD